MTTITTRILNLQKILHLSSKEIAQTIEFSEAAFQSAIEFPTEAFLRHLCSAFGVSLSYLKEGVGPMFAKQMLPVADILAFRDERNWKQFHTPKDLAISLSLEASELLECFQWSGSDVEAKEKHGQMREELADILIYSVLFADAIGVDIPSIIGEKLAKNGKKYEVSKAYGNAKKYTEFDESGGK
jgi:NTP pyrophosphatase (non-canonical NTP hydrolase)